MDIFSSSSTVVEYLTHHYKVWGLSSPIATEKMTKNVVQIIQETYTQDCIQAKLSIWGLYY